MNLLRRFRKTARTAGIALAALVVAGVAAVDDVSAASRVCRQLEAQLAKTSAGGGSAQERRYAGAIERQRRQLSIARRQAREIGCGSGVFGRKVRQCAQLNGTIGKMNANLASLQRKHQQMGGRGGGKARARILASLDANGCRAGGQAVAVRRPQDEVGARRRNLLEQILGARAEQERPRIAERDDGQLRGRTDGERRVRRVIDPQEGRITIAPESGYATVCVRTCDGYMFPMSPSSSTSDFGRDQKNCEASCPGTEMQVFFREPGTGGDSALMSVATGRAYSELATAFRYKDAAYKRPADCGCNAQRNFEVVAGTPPAAQTEAPADEAAAVPSPLPDAAPAADEAAVTTTAIQPSPSITILPAASPPKAVEQPQDDRAKASADADEVEPDPLDRKVRVVGPAFLPDPEAAIDLRAPAPQNAP